jgi:hypothetical protein
MADVAGFSGIGGMYKHLNQLRSVGLVHIVATETIGPDQRLPLMSPGNRLTFQVMTSRTQLARIFLLVVLEFQLPRSPSPVCDMTGIASPVQGGMPAPFFRYI